VAATTDASICSLALGKIHQPAIVGLGDENVRASACRRWYPVLRDELLSFHDWGFANKRIEITSDPGYVMIGDEHDYAYELPSDPYCLVVRELIDDSSDWEIEGRHLLTNQSSPIKLRYTTRANEAFYPQYFVVALATRIATEIASELGADIQMTQVFDAQFNGPGGIREKAVAEDIREKQRGQQVQASRGSRLWRT
jgi:hypothetical protein